MEALAITEQLLHSFPLSAALFNVQGAIHAGLSHVDEAVDSYLQATIINPDFAEAYNNMGVVLSENGDYGEAIDSYRKAYEIKPDFAEAYYGVGVARHENGDLDGAIGSYRRALEVAPEYAEASNNLAVVLGEKGDFIEALNSYRNAIKIKPNFAAAHYGLGIALQEIGDLDGALQSYGLALKLTPDNAKIYNSIGNTLEEKGDLAGAIDSFERAVDIKPDYPEALNNLGIALHEMGDFHGAVERYRRAINFRPDFRYAWDNIFLSLKVLQSQADSLDDQLPLLLNTSLPISAHIQLTLLEYRLKRGEAIADVLMDRSVNLMSTAQNMSIKSPQKISEKLELRLNLPKKIVALLHFGRSGTGLLHSLIEGHSQVSTLPSIYFSEFYSATSWERLTAGGWYEMPDRFIAMYPVLFDATAPDPVATIDGKTIASIGRKEGMTNVGEGRDEALTLDKAIFRKALQQLMQLFDEIDASVFFKLIHIAYEKALNKSEIKKSIFYHIHNPDLYSKFNFKASSPDANWLMMVREPIQSCESWVKEDFSNNQHLSILRKIESMLFQIDDDVFRSQRSVGVRLEDLKERPKETILALCKWMGIDEEDSLYEMTAQGKKWWGDPSSPDYGKEAMTPFVKSSIKRKVGSVFSDTDQFILRTLFYPFSVRFSYAVDNLDQFKKDLYRVRPMLDQVFDFERILLSETKGGEKQFINSSAFKYFRSGLVDRWNILNEFHTYPNMLGPLPMQ